MSISASTASAADNWLSIVLSYWWVFLLFGGVILEFVGDVFTTVWCALTDIPKHRHERRMELRRLELEARGEGVPPTAPGLCRHRKAVPVRGAEGDVLAWLCRACDTQLPRDFSVYEEDL